MAKLHDKETQSIAATVSDVLEGKKSVKEVEQPKAPSGKNGPQTGEVDFKKKHVAKKSGMKNDGSNIKEKKVKAGRGKETIDIDYIGNAKQAKDAMKKHKVKIKMKCRGTADVSGDKQAIVNMMMDPDIMGFDAEDLEDIYPELFEDVKEEEEVEEAKEEPKDEQTEKQKKYQAFFQKALKKFGVKSPSELDKEKRKEFFNYVDKNYDAGEGETD